MDLVFARQSGKFVIVMVVLLQLAVVSAQGQTQITTCGTVIDKPGKYALANDLQCSGVAISVTSYGVLLDLGGRTITGPGNGNGIGVDAHLSRREYGKTTIINGSITDMGTGINLWVDCSDCALIDLEYTQVSNSGIGYHIQGSKAYKVNVLRNYAESNSWGFVVEADQNGGCWECEFDQNEAYANFNDGFQFTRVFLGGVRENQSWSNGGNGIAAGHSTTNIVSNTAENNGKFDLFQGTGDEGYDQCIDIWIDNTYRTKNLQCIH